MSGMDEATGHEDALQLNDQVFRPATGQYGRVGATSEDGSVQVVWEPERPSWHYPSDLRKV